jgi:hypothetical protein
MPLDALRSRWRASPWGFLGMLALVAVIEWGLGRHEIDFRLPIENQWRAQGRESRRQAVKAEILCLGDSLVAQGVIPAVLEQRLGLRTYNLGLGGGQFPAHYFLLRRALEAGAKPSALVIDAMPLQLTIPAANRATLWANLLDVREAVQMAWITRDPSFLGQFLLAKRIPSIRSRLEIRRVILEGLGGTTLSNREANLAASRNLRLNQGALILPHYDGNFQVNPRHHRWVYPSAVQADRLNGEFMERFLDLAESRGIPVFWLLTPVCPEIQSKAEQVGTFETHARFVREVQSRHPSITVFDARRSAYPESALDDSIHLSQLGAAIFTTDLADAMARILDGSAGSKWVQLPPFRPRSIEFRHEDLAESRQALARPVKK